MWAEIFSLARLSWKGVVVIAVTILFVASLASPSTRWLGLGLLALVGPLASYGGLLALVLGRLGVTRALYVGVGLCCGAVAALTSTMALFAASSGLLTVAVGSSLVSTVFAVTGFSRTRTTSRRFVPPVESE